MKFLAPWHRASLPLPRSLDDQVTSNILKDKYMRNIAKKKSWPLAVAYGIKPEDVIPLATHIDSRVSANLGWIQLHFGWDDKWCEVLYAVTENDTFLLTAASKLSPVFIGPAKTCEWVYAIDGLPDDFLDERAKPTALEYAGFYVLHGVDSQYREFIYVSMPNAELHILIRNPAARLTNAWAPRRAVAFGDSMVIDPLTGAKELQPYLEGDFIFDDDLEKLLGGDYEE